ncbi:MAG: hypothetical protein CM1200mP2_49040 [Planctomycetaceae bacterium]|nr:MAG: hypothetical protein CM1200mP2_49040 [Planctomycetaceae bacterium]
MRTTSSGFPRRPAAPGPRPEVLPGAHPRPDRLLLADVLSRDRDTTKAHEAGQITDEQLNDIHCGKLLWYHQIRAHDPGGPEEPEGELRLHDAFT